MKRCIRCETRKPVEDFLLHYNKQRGKHYRRGVCKACRTTAARDNFESKDRRNAAKRNRYQTDPEYRQRQLSQQHKARHGITVEEKLARVETQGGCAACGTNEPGSKGWATDHDHTCCPGTRSCGNCIRGILCQSCNLALGHAGDSPQKLQALIDYLMLAGMSPGGNPQLGASVSRMAPI